MIHDGYIMDFARAASEITQELTSGLILVLHYFSFKISQNLRFAKLYFLLENNMHEGSNRVVSL